MDGGLEAMRVLQVIQGLQSGVQILCLIAVLIVASTSVRNANASGAFPLIVFSGGEVLLKLADIIISSLGAWLSNAAGPTYRVYLLSAWDVFTIVIQICLYASLAVGLLRLAKALRGTSGNVLVEK